MMADTNEIIQITGGFLDGADLSDDSVNGTEIVDALVLESGSSVTLGDGVVFSEPSNGILTITGAGDGSDEDIVVNFDDTANTVAISSGTGVSSINTGSIGFVTTGTISAAVPTLLTTGTTFSPTGTQVYGSAHHFNNAAVVTITLPAAVAGMNACFIDFDTTAILTIDIDGADQFLLGSTALAAGNTVDSPGDLGDFICVLALDAQYWMVLGKQGTWVDGGAS
jgi:hypothetical protein